MPKNLSSRKGNVKNIRSNSLRATKKTQKLNLQVKRLANGQKIRISNKEFRDIQKMA